MMAISLVYCPPLSNSRIGQVCMCSYSRRLKRGIACISIFMQEKKCVKLYMVPTKAIDPQRMFKASALVGLSSADAACEENLGSSGPSTSADFLRSKTEFEPASIPADGMKDFEGELQELFGEVKILVKERKINDAVDLLQANYEAVKERIDAGAGGIEEAATLDVIALGYLVIGNKKLVGGLLDMLDKVVCGLKDDEPLLDSVLMHMGSMYYALGKLDKSILSYQRAIALMERFYGENSTVLVSPLLGMAKVLGSIGRVTKAVEVYHWSLTILETNRGSESEDLVVPLSGLGKLLIKEGRAADAESVFSRILSIYTKLYGENDERVGMALSCLANAKCLTGNAENAIDLYKRAIQIIKDAKYKASNDSIVEKMRVDLAGLLHVVGRGSEGRELLKECLLDIERYKGRDHPSSVTHLMNLATSYSQAKNFAEAERLLRVSLEIMMKTVRADDQSISFPMLHLAVTLSHLNQDEEAENLALEALRIRHKAFGKDSLPVGEALDCLASIQTKLEKPDAGILKMLRQVLKIQDREFGSESKEVMETLKKVVYYLDKMGKKDEKLPLHKRLHVLRSKLKQMVQF